MHPSSPPTGLRDLLNGDGDLKHLAKSGRIEKLKMPNYFVAVRIDDDPRLSRGGGKGLHLLLGPENIGETGKRVSCYDEGDGHKKLAKIWDDRKFTDAEVHGVKLDCIVSPGSLCACRSFGNTRDMVEASCIRLYYSRPVEASLKRTFNDKNAF